MTNPTLVYDLSLIKHFLIFGTKKNTAYHVLYFPDHKVQCFCAAFSYNKKDCWHVRVVRLIFNKSQFIINESNATTLKNLIAKRDNETLEAFLGALQPDSEGIPLIQLFEVSHDC